MLWLCLLLTSLLCVASFLLIRHALRERRKARKETNGDSTGLQVKHPRWKKVKRGLLVFGVAGAIVFSSFYVGNRVAFARTVGGSARWVQTGGQSYLYVEADTSYDLGYHTGVHLANQIVTLQSLLFTMALVQGFNYLEMERCASEYLPYIPAQYQQELQGIADGATGQSGLLVTFANVLLQAVFFDLFYGRVTPAQQVQSATLGCTTLGANNSDDSIILGQNVDLVKTFSPVQSFVLHKLGDDPLVFTYRFGACPAMPIGKNEYDVTVNLNLVQTNIIAPITTPAFVLAREGLAHNKTAVDLCQTLLSGGQSSYSRNFVIADDTQIIAVQVLPYNHTTDYTATALVRTNTFIDLYWQTTLANPTYSKERQVYAEGVLTHNYADGYLSDGELLSILQDAPIICRDEEGTMGTATVAFMTRHSFGIGIPSGAIGIVPI